MLALLLAASIVVRPAADAAKLPHEARVLHFWATWCGACREEFPRIRAALEKLPSVLLVAVDKPADAAKVRAALRRFKVSKLPSIILDAPDPDPVAKGIGEPKWDGALPATFVFDAEGKLVKSFLGRADPAELLRAAR